MIWLLLFLTPFLLGAQVGTVEIVTTGDKSYQSGSNKNPQFVVPADSTATFKLTFTCIPNIDYTVRLRTSTDGGNTWTTIDHIRKAAPCKTKFLEAKHVRAKAWTAGTIVETEVITKAPLNSARLDISFSKSR